MIPSDYLAYKYASERPLSLTASLVFEQSYGGVNEKIEGLFDICCARGLSGNQGVIIPAANQPHLILKPDVVAAVQAGRFHIYTATHVEDVMETLSGFSAGRENEAYKGEYEEGTFSRLVMDRVQQFHELQNSFAENNDNAG